ncbi:hypothetical protein AL552_07470 [Vibrio diabolicus]|nr:hypothetical protein AL552_07470 [Vibrio diabolicus]
MNVAVNGRAGRLWLLEKLDCECLESTRDKHDCLKSGVVQSMKGINCLTQSLGSDVNLNQLFRS